jgi:hypothetical protein
MLKHVDFENPADSKLLAFAASSHGGQSTPAFTPDDLAFQLLQRWVYSVSKHPEKYLTEVIQHGSSPVAVSPTIESAAAEHDVAPVGFVETVSSPVAPPQPNGQPQSQFASPPSDPCDPMLFNRRHHPNRTR